MTDDDLPLIVYDERLRCTCPEDRRTAPCWRKATQEDLLCDFCQGELPMSVDVWAAVDKLTAETRHKMPRDAAGEWVTGIHDATDGVCNIAAYRAATTGWATIPSLWDQSTIALFGAEVAAGRGSKPLRERSLADLDLLEIRSLIRDTATDHLEQWEQRRPKWTAGEFGNEQIRHFASVAVQHVGERCTQCRCTHETDFWQYRFAQWATLLETYLRAAEHQVKPVYLRNSPCPTCRTSQVTVERDGEPIVTPAIVIDFRDGYVRAAQCQACGDAWFRGPDLEWLAGTLGEGFDTQQPVGAMSVGNDSFNTHETAARG